MIGALITIGFWLAVVLFGIVGLVLDRRYR
jgi:hypothetical protein